MIPTATSRILRNSLRACPSASSPRTLSTICAYRRHLPQTCLRSQVHAPRAAFTTSSNHRAKEASAPSPRPTEPNEPSPTPDEHWPLSPHDANPPATTRPAPLDLPTRAPNQSTPSFYFATGKAYLKFYKTGLKNIYHNTRLVYALDTAASPTPRGAAPTPATQPLNTASRAAFLLRRRWRYDIRRLPPFALILLVCGEFTPFIVLAFPALVPYTCRIPRQLAAQQRKTLARRAASVARFAPRVEDETARNAERWKQKHHSKFETALEANVVVHIARSLNLVSPLWDRVLGAWDGADELVARVAARKVRAHLLYLCEDDLLLVRAGGVDALVAEEVVLACRERALDTDGGDEDEAALRSKLAGWLVRTGGVHKNGDDAQDLLGHNLLRLQLLCRLVNGFQTADQKTLVSKNLARETRNWLLQRRTW